MTKSYKLTYNDSNHSYYLNGRRCKSVTAVAKIAPDSYALDQWRKRMVAIGMTLDKSLAERVAVDPTNKAAVDEICEHALEIAKANDAARRGTQRHRASELVDTGGELLTDQQRADAQAWLRTLEHHKIEILPEFVEGFAIWPEHGVTGRFDRIARVDGRLGLLDLKSGENAVKYPQGTAVQLALYANAPLISASVSTSGDKTTVTDWRPPPADLDLSVGYVVLLNDDTEVGELWKIDIAHGMAGARHALSLVDWRKEHSYGADLAERADGTDMDGAAQLLQRELGAVPIPLPEQIATARSRPELEQIWADNQEWWSDWHTDATKKRLAELGQ